jgi:phospholipid/cholesterol/gamma-HCH transport system substrate-binding protein
VNLGRRIIVQLAIFAVVSLVAAVIMVFGYVKLPAMFGIGRYTVTIELPRSGGLYPTGNVTYRGTQVGKVQAVHLTANGHVEAVLSLSSGIEIPSDLTAEVHSQTAVGEQYVALLPHNGTSRPLRDGDVIGLNATSVPPDIDKLLDATNRGLQAIPHDSLRTAIDESYTAIGGLGPELSRIVKGSSALASDARANLDALTSLIDQSAPVLDSQTETSGEIQAWASNLAEITAQLRDNDTALAELIDNGGPTAESARVLVERLQPTLPVILANLVSVGKVAVTYQNGIEQLLVLVPQAVAGTQAGAVANLNTKQDYSGSYLDFNLNFNLPPPCTTGYLPARQRRPAVMTDTPDRPEGDLYCRVPQESPFNVRGVRNIPCATVPGKRSPTVKLCESDEHYVPLNDGYNWKGDPNATLSGQDIPQLPPGQASENRLDSIPPAPLPPVAIAEYDPATGTYVGPDGQAYTQADLARDATGRSWQDMLMPNGN